MTVIRVCYQICLNNSLSKVVQSMTSTFHTGENQKRNGGCKYGAVATQTIRASQVGAPLKAQKAQNFQNELFLK